MRGLLALALLVGCANPRIVAAAMDTLETDLARAHSLHARVCAPAELAQATSNLQFARLEARQGDVRRANEHLQRAQVAVARTLEVATPCGTLDSDGDTVADIVDRCPDEKEDLDGDMDEDGCRDMSPQADEDNDGIANIDDACVDDPEDMDGDQDDDGCPETSLDADGDGYIDAVDRCPTEPEDKDGWEDEDGCPEVDNDLDGINDLMDGCPTIKEDRDGWADHDGCPDPDNDGDGLPDVTDLCPDEAGAREQEGCPAQDGDGDGVADERDLCPTAAETVNDYLDRDGCPDVAPTRVRVRPDRIEVLEAITFEAGGAVLASGQGALDDVSRVLRDAPDLRLRIEGHTDSDGDDAANLALSQERARAVKRYLIEKGVPAARLESDGLGEARPIDTNRTPQGRARNRRVELVLLP